MSSPPFDGRKAPEAFGDVSFGEVDGFSYEEYLNGKYFRTSNLLSQTADIVVDYLADDLVEDSVAEHLHLDGPAPNKSGAILRNTTEAQMAPGLRVEEEAGNTPFTAQQVHPSAARTGGPAAPSKVPSSALPHFGHGTTRSSLLPAGPTSHMSALGNHFMTQSTAYQDSSSHGQQQPNGYSLMNPSLPAPPRYNSLTRAVHYGINPTSGKWNMPPSISQVTQPLIQSTQSLASVPNQPATVPSQSDLPGDSTS